MSDFETLRWFSHWDCYKSPHWFYIITYCIILLTVICNFVVLFTCVYHLYIRKEKKLDQYLEKPVIKRLFICINIFYTLCPLGFSFGYSLSISCLFPGISGRLIFYYIMVYAAAANYMAMVFLYLFFMLRMKALFDGFDHLKLNKSIFYLLLSGTITQPFCEFASVYYYTSSANPPWTQAIRWAYTALVSGIIYGLLLIFIFIVKIKQLTKYNDSFKQKTVERYLNERKAIIFLIRYLLLAITALISVNLVNLINVYRNFVKDDFYVMMTNNILLVIDSFINVLCIYLQAPFASELYYTICFCCNSGILWITGNDGTPADGTITATTTTTCTTTTTTTTTVTMLQLQILPQLPQEITKYDAHPSLSINLIN